MIQANASSAPGVKRAGPLTVRDFRLLWIGETVSLLGDQFTIVAYPWLVLQLTRDPLILGAVMGLMGIPRALFMLIGGAVVDRFSPRTVMFVTNAARMLLVTLLALLTLTGGIQIWMLYVFALGFGLADAFYFPSQTSIVPQILNKDQLQVGNTLVQGMAQLAMFVGPVLAGGAVALFGGTSGSNGQALPSMIGIGIAFVIDALSFVASVAALWLMHTRKKTQADETTRNVLRAISEGLKFVWKSESLRRVFILVVAMNMFFVGPFVIGIPVLANTRLPEGAAAYGIILSAFGGGALVGILLSGILPTPKPARFGSITLSLLMLLGLGLALIPFGATTAIIAVVALLSGCVNGYVNISFFTWLQKRIPDHLMGRVMSLIMFASTGLVPVSMAVVGGLVKINLNAVFVGAGILMSLSVVYALTSKAIRQMGLEAELGAAASSSESPYAVSEMPAFQGVTSEVPTVVP